MSAPKILGDHGALGHPARFTAGKLDHKGFQPVGAPRPAHHIGPGADQFFAGHHFGHNQACPMGVRHGAERLVRHARQGCQENPVAGFDGSDLNAHFFIT